MRHALTWHCAWCHPLTEAQLAEPGRQYTSGICADCREVVERRHHQPHTLPQGTAALERNRARGRAPA